MKESCKKILQIFEKMVRIRAKKESHQWPPPCRAALHQPKRPKKRNIKTTSLLSKQRNET